jgi:osmotically-inducible protein OsmY
MMDKRDSELQQEVMNELKWDPSVMDTEINVTANNGIVTLRGSVPHYFEKSTASEAAHRVNGVRAVADEIVVNILGAYERSDEDIARAAVTALAWNYQAPKDVDVTVSKAWITLTGEADWDYQRTAAKNAVSMLLGVAGVTNDIAIKRRVQISDVKRDIESALKRSAENEARDIKVVVEGNRVTLSGKVHSAEEISDARIAAWNAPGVMMVEDTLKIVH